MPKMYPGYREEIKKRIIAEACALFLEKGFADTTMDEIAAKLDVTKPALYRYFRTKEELFFFSAIETGMAGFHNFFADSFASDDLLTGAGVYFDSLLDFTRKFVVISLDAALVIQRNKFIRESIPGYRMDGILTMQHFFEEKKKQGKITTDLDGRELALLCSSLSEGLIGNVMEGIDPAEAKKVWITGFARLAGIRAGKSR